jgi:amphi-Trp domain-containing protein
MAVHALTFAGNLLAMSEKDITKEYTKDEFVSKLRRLADSIESGENFRISIAGEPIYVPDRARFTIEHERGDGENEIEFQATWEDE